MIFVPGMIFKDGSSLYKRLDFIVLFSPASTIKLETRYGYYRAHSGVGVYDYLGPFRNDKLYTDIFME